MAERQLLEWRPGRRAVDQTALMAEHSECARCHDAREVVVGYEDGDAAWGPCPECNADGKRPIPSLQRWWNTHGAAFPNKQAERTDDG